MRLSVVIGAGKKLTGSLDAETKPMQEPRNVLPMIFDTVLPANQFGDHAGSPDAGFKARGLGALLDQSFQLLHLRLVEFGWATWGMTRS